MNKGTLGKLFSHTPIPSIGADRDAVHYLVLYALVRILQPETCVEIGSYKGDSAVWIAQALEDNGGVGRLVCVDPFVGIGEGKMPLFWEKVYSMGLEDLVYLVEKRSEEAVAFVPTKIDFLFIDGDHSKEGCLSDIEKYVPKLTSGGVVAFHDYQTCPGVKEAIHSYEPFKDFAQFSVPTSFHGMYVAVRP